MTRHFFKLTPGLLAAAALFNTVAFGQSPTVVTTDKVHGYPGIVRGPSQFLSGTGGHTGQAGDYGMDFGRSGGGATVAVTNASFMNFAATNDIITISLWLRRYDIANSSVFWGHATSVSRGIQAHAPWSDDTIYFDAGNGGAGRISQNISSFPDYQTVGDDSWWTNWHHLVFVKNGSDAQIWIDSQEFHSGTMSLPLATNFFDLYIGASGPAAGDNNMHGIMDDFAVFSTAVTPANITNLYTGALPTALSGETVLAYWDFNDPPVIMPPVGNFQGFSIRVNDLGGNVLNTNSIVLSLNGNNVVPTSVTKLASTATITYLLPNPPFASGSTQYTGISIRDQGGTLYTNYAFFVAPQLLVPPASALAVSAVDKSKPGFKIRTFQVDNEATGNGVDVAEDILDGKYGTNVANLFDADGVDANGFFTWTNVVNLDVTPANKNGSFNDPDYPDFNFPGIPGNPSTINANEHFACEFFTALEFTTAGEYTMVVNSDDDFRTTTGLNPMDTFSALTVGEFNDPGGRGASDTTFKFFIQQPGLYGFRTVYEQSTGGGNIEWFMITNNIRVLINDTTNAIKAYLWQPIITAAYVKTVFPAKDANFADPDLVQAVIVDGTNTISPGQVSLKIDGVSVGTATVSRSAPQTTITYKPNPLFAPKSQHTAAVQFVDGTNQVSRTWQFKVADYTKDKLHNYWGSFQERVAYSANGGGRSGTTGDYSADFGHEGNGGLHIKHAGDFLNIAGTNDEMSFSLWIKKYDIADSSAFWANTPSASGGRGWQAHTPWSDDRIYFDTADPNSFERISGNITSFSGYTGNDGFWTNWHHFLFFKKADTTKQVWIDGQVFLDGVAANPLPTDFTDMYLGSAGDGSGNMHGLIDDFAVFATALGTNDVTLLAGGALPTALSPSTKLLAYWDFNDATSVTRPTIAMSVVNGRPTITYTGTLQSSTTVDGTYSDVVGATSPYSTPAGSPRGFYRARN